MIERRNLKPVSILKFWGLLFLFSACAAASYIPDQVIVKFKSDTQQEIRDQIISLYDCSLVEKCMYADVHLLQVPESQTPEQMISAFQDFNEVEYADFNHTFYMLLEPNDPLFFYQWNLHNDANGGVNMEKAWDIEKGDPNVVIAVLDSGAAYENYGIYRQAPDQGTTLSTKIRIPTTT